jgi:YYY domain-containing protein
VIDFLRWLIAIEIVGLTFLPLTCWFLRALPDRGYAFARVLGLLLVTFAMWWLGSLAPVANSTVLLWLLVLLGASGWLVWWRPTLENLRTARWAIIIEEILFITALIVWAWIRSFSPDINGTEKFMDLMLLQVSGRAHTFPPYDAWLAGYTVNYYYFGYLMMATLGHLASTAPTITFNLALALLFALGISSTYSLTYNLTCHHRWSLGGPILVMLLGNAHSFFFQVLQGKLPWNQYLWFWESSRIVGDSANVTATINEFPLFSFVLGDLHPHIMAIPEALLALAVALAYLLSHEFYAGAIARLILTAIVVGSLFAVNSWDLPTYLIIVAGAVIAAAYLNSKRHLGTPPGNISPDARTYSNTPLLAHVDTMLHPPPLPSKEHSEGTHLTVVEEAPFSTSEQGKVTWSTYSGWFGMRIHAHGSVPLKNPPWWAIAGASVVFLAIASVALYAPFYLHLQPATHGIGRVTTRTDFGQFAQIFGFMGLLALGFLATIAWKQGWLSSVLLEAHNTPSEAGGILPSSGESIALGLLAVAALALAAFLHLWVLLVTLTTAIVAIYILTDQPLRLNRSDLFTLGLIAMAGLILAGTELVYLRDPFDGSAAYRMNTVFKFYYEAWILLGLAGAYSAYRVFITLRNHSRTATLFWSALLAAGLVVGGVYTVLAPISYYSANSGEPVFHQSGLDGMHWMASADPGDYAAIRWLQRHVTDNSTILEATGDDYTTFARVSTFTGLPTLLGWGGHEGQWRGYIPLLQERHTLIDEIYSTGNAHLAQQLLKQNRVSLVYVGPCEEQIYGTGSASDLCGGGESAVHSAPNALTKFRTFMQTIYNHTGVTIYRLR